MPIWVGTDPDCDRLGVAVRNKGKMTLLNGNQTMVLMTAFNRTMEKKAGESNGKQFVSTIVSTPMMMELATNIMWNVK
jgi:phosphomannomutase